MLLNKASAGNQPGNGAELKISEFKEHGTASAAMTWADRGRFPRQGPSTLALLLDPTPLHLGELAWRMGLALAALNFVVIAVPCPASTRARAQRGNLMFALCLPSSFTTTCSTWASAGSHRSPLNFALHAGAAWRHFWSGPAVAGQTAQQLVAALACAGSAAPSQPPGGAHENDPPPDLHRGRGQPWPLSRWVSGPVLLLRLVDELAQRGPRRGWLPNGTRAAYVALRVPSHLYELLPIAVLIGTIFVMARLAQSSEYTILRTSGLGPWRALRMLLSWASFVLLTFATGDYVAPWPTAQRSCSRPAFRAHHHRPDRRLDQGTAGRNSSVNVGRCRPTAHAGSAHV
jgi:hypothetical protein